MERACRSRHGRSGVLISAFVLGLLGQGVQAQPVVEGAERQLRQKAVWQWTVGERLAARFDASAEEARAAQGEARSRDAFPGSPSPVVKLPVGHTVRGDETPELFLSFELCDALINRSFPPDGRQQSEWRRRYEEGAAALGLGRDIWPRIEKAAAAFLEGKREHYRLSIASPLHERVDRVVPDRIDMDSCRARAQAMAAVGSELGSEVFLRLLYEVVAPSLHMSYAYQQELSDHLRFLEGGCR
jgi:hypothetical protein